MVEICSWSLIPAAQICWRRPSFVFLTCPTSLPAPICHLVPAEGEQGVPIPPLRGRGSARRHRQHTKHQEHVGERQRVLLARGRRRSVQGKRPAAGAEGLAGSTASDRWLTFGPILKQEAAVMKTGVAGRINDWLNKTPESGKSAGGRPSVGGSRSRASLCRTAEGEGSVLERLE